MEERKSSIGRWISLLYRYGQMYAGEELKEYGVGKGQYIFLNALYRKDGINQERLSDDLKIDKGTTAKALKKLEEDGFVKRLVSHEDKRSYNIHLTEKGHEVVPKIKEVLVNWRNILTEGLSEEEKEQALDLLERMGGRAAAHVDQAAYTRTTARQRGEDIR